MLKHKTKKFTSRKYFVNFPVYAATYDAKQNAFMFTSTKKNFVKSRVGSRVKNNSIIVSADAAKKLVKTNTKNRRLTCDFVAIRPPKKIVKINKNGNTDISTKFSPTSFRKIIFVSRMLLKNFFDKYNTLKGN